MRNACHIPLISLLSTSNWPCLGLSAFKVSTLSKKRLFFNIRLTESVFPYTILTTPDALSHKPSSILRARILAPYAPRKGVTLVTPFFVVYQAIKALGADGEHIKIGCIFTGNLPVFPDFYRYFHL